jgi:hypothetical protein
VLERGAKLRRNQFQAGQRGCRQAVEPLGVFQHRGVATLFDVMQDGGNRLFDGGIGGVVELQQAGEARLKIRLRTIEAGKRNHKIPASK